MKVKGGLSSRTRAFQINHAEFDPSTEIININSINNLPHKPKFTSKPKIVFFHILFLITSNQNWMEAGKTSFPNYRIKLQWSTEQRLSRKMLSKKNSDLARYVCTHL